MFFVFGTLGPGIKLLAMEGMPWVKAWGAMFLSSFVVVEGLVMLSWGYGDFEAVPGSHDIDDGKLREIRAKLSRIGEGS